MSAEATPWRAMVALAAQFGVTPSAFWRLSLREWRALAVQDERFALSRATFDALAAQFPDERA